MTTSTNPLTNTLRRAGRTAFALGLASVSLFPLGCGRISGQMRSDPPLLASAPAGPDVAVGRAIFAHPPGAPSRGRYQLPQDLAERTMFMQAMRVQIVQKTHRLSDGRYHHARPGLTRQMLAMGLRSDEVDFILTDVDGSRTRRAR